MHVEPYILRMEEVAASGHACVLIDDGGTPGQLAGSPYLHPSRKTWVAVLTTATQVKEICQQMPRAIEELKLQTGATEFHFAEIYRGAGAFEDKPLSLRLALFGFMRQIRDSHVPRYRSDLECRESGRNEAAGAGSRSFRGEGRPVRHVATSGRCPVSSVVPRKVVAIYSVINNCACCSGVLHCGYEATED